MYKVTVSANRNAKRRGCGLGHRLHSKKEKSADKTLQDTVVYTDAYDEADLTYSVENTGIKENIIINEKKNVYRYSFVLNCENLTCTQGEDGIIRFLSCESGEEIFYIPVSFMYDAEGVTSYAVTQELRTHGNDTILTVSCDSSWINADERVFPVTVDPQISTFDVGYLATYSAKNGVILSGSVRHTVGWTKENNAYVDNHMLLRINISDYMPLMRIKKAELNIKQENGSITSGKILRIGAYRINGDIAAGGAEPQSDDMLADYAIAGEGNGREYIFDVTSIVADSYAKEDYADIVIKTVDDDAGDGNVTLYGSNNFQRYKTQLVVTYEPIYASADKHVCNTHSIGRNITGSNDINTGTLTLDVVDFAWKGNRMPVTIKHIYNNALRNRQYTGDDSIYLNLVDFSEMQVGYGCRLNVMQGIKSVGFTHEGKYYAGYVYTDGEGKEIYFKDGGSAFDYINGGYYDTYICMDDEEVYYDPLYRRFTLSGKTYQFDEAGRLIKITDTYGNTNEINYTADRITSVTDGAGRSFDFAYTWDGYLTSITAPDETCVCYSYTNGNLTGITYPDGSQAVIEMKSDGPKSVTLKDAHSVDLYRVDYTYESGRIKTVTEYGVSEGEYIQGASSEYSYNVAARRTLVATTQLKDECECETEDTIIKTVYAFDDDGNVVSQYSYTEDGDNASASGGAGINPYMGDGGAVYTKSVENLLSGHGFNTLDGWVVNKGSCDDIDILIDEWNSYYGKNCVMFKSYNACACEGGISQSRFVNLNGDMYTFSAYVKICNEFTGINNPGIFLRVKDMEGNILSESERICGKTDGYERLSTTFTGYTGLVTVYILICGKGIAYADGAQLEKGDYASEYTLIENGSFENDLACWNSTMDVQISNNTYFNGSRSLKLESNSWKIQYAYQEVPVKTEYDTRETFTLSGWAKGMSVPKRTGAKKEKLHSGSAQ